MAPKAKSKKPTKSAKKKAPPQKSKAVVKKAKAVLKKAKAVVQKAAAAVKKAAPKKAAGHTSIAPGFTANDAKATITWYTDVLGFKLVEEWIADGVFLGGSVAHGSIQINIGQDDWKLGRDRVKGQGTHTYIETALNIDKYAADIKARGGVLKSEPADGWGVRAFSIEDPDGFKLTFMSHKK